MSSQISPELITTALRTYLHSDRITDKLISVAEDGLNATRPIFDKKGNLIATVPDHTIRHKFFHDYCDMRKEFAPLENKNPTDVRVIIIREREVSVSENKPELNNRIIDVKQTDHSGAVSVQVS